MNKSVAIRLFLSPVVITMGILSQINVPAQPDGTPLWTNRYNGPGNGNDRVYAMAVDGNGNVIVTGSSYGLGTDDDYATVKYSSAGVPLWTNRHNGPDNFYDRALAVAVDGNGNTFVTGSSVSIDGEDYGTIKYSSAGVPLWTRRYSVPGVNTWDIPAAIAVDGGGNVIVTGSSSSLGDDPDYVTIKYSGAGVPLWTNRYDGVANSNDYAAAIVVDGSGNAIVTGASDDSNGWFDYATVKYSTAGVPLWTNRFGGSGNHDDRARALAVDKAGAVFVTGYSWRSGGGSESATIKYSSTGVALWTNRYNVDYDDRTSAIAVDGSGNVFVTGFSYGIGSGSDYVTIKYLSTGVPLWTNRYKMNSTAFVNGIAVDSSGNAYVTGYSFSHSPVNSDCITIKYSNTGALLWTNHYEGPANGEDAGVAVAVDTKGNALVTGYSDGSGTGYDYVTIKYSGTGGPSLNIAHTATNTLVVSWPSPAADFTLQQNTSVSSTNWTAVGLSPADDGTNKTVIVDPPEGNRFYRLFHP